MSAVRTGVRAYMDATPLYARLTHDYVVWEGGYKQLFSTDVELRTLNSQIGFT